MSNLRDEESDADVHHVVKAARMKLRNAMENHLREQERLFEKLLWDLERAHKPHPTLASAPAEPNADMMQPTASIVRAKEQELRNAHKPHPTLASAPAEPNADMMQPTPSIVRAKEQELRNSPLGLMGGHSKGRNFKQFELKMPSVVVGKLSQITLTEPPRVGRLANLCRTFWFNTFINVAILLNTLFVVYVTVYRQQDEMILAAGRGEHDLHGQEDVFWIVDFCFWCLFVIEFAVKFAVHRFYFFVNQERKWNWLDFLVISSAGVDYLVSSRPMEVLFVRSLRIFRLLRVLRTLRTLKLLRALEELRTILDSILESLNSLFWSLCVITILNLFFSIVFVQFTTNHATSVSDNGYFKPEVEALMLYFGRLDRAFLTLLHSTLGGDWLTYYKAVSIIGVEANIVFLFYLCFYQVAIWNIVTSVFVEKAMTNAASDRQRVASLMRKQEEKTVEGFKDVLSSCNVDDDNYITKAEFIQLLGDPSLNAQLRISGLDITDPMNFWDMVVTTFGDDKVDLSCLATAFMRLGGPATRAGMYTLKHDIFQMRNSLEGIIRQYASLSERLIEIMAWINRPKTSISM